jgi:hypothetical protein
MADLMVVKWYATVLRQNMFAEKVAEIAPVSLHYGATQYRVHVDQDDRYKINQMTWVPDHKNWYAFWEGPEMIEFRARWMGKYQVPITYAWTREVAAGGADAEIYMVREPVVDEFDIEASVADADAS